MTIFKPRKIWTVEALLGGLRKLCGDQNMTWMCPEQEQAIEVIMSGRERVVAILPTGSGKSLLYTLPCTLNRPASLAPERLNVTPTDERAPYRSSRVDTWRASRSSAGDR